MSSTVSSFYAKRNRFKSGKRPQAVPPRPVANGKEPLRLSARSRETERDLTRFRHYLDVESGLSPLTVRKYCYGCKRLKEWARSKRKSLSDLTTSDCRRWLLSVAREAYSASTINGMHAAAQRFFDFLLTEGDLTTNPFKEIPYLQLEKSLPRFLSQEEVAQLMAAPDTSTYAGLLDRTVMELLYASGMRVAELINQRIDRVDLDNCRILCTGKRSKQRVVLFGRDAKKWLEKYLVARSRIPKSGKSPSLFLKIDGKPLYGTLIWRHIKEYADMAGLGPVSPHTLRHSFATHLHEGGASTRHVQLLLGHENLESAQVYTHMSPTHLRKTYDLHHPRATLKRTQRVPRMQTR